MVEMLTFMVHRRQELERKEAEEELAQAGGEQTRGEQTREEQTRGEQTREEQLAHTREEQTREEQLQQAREEQLLQPTQAREGEELQAQARAKLGEENPSHASIPPNKAKETPESGLLPSSKRFKSCFWSNKRTVVHNTRCEAMAPCGSPLSASSPLRSARPF